MSAATARSLQRAGRVALLGCRTAQGSPTALRGLAAAADGGGAASGPPPVLPPVQVCDPSGITTSKQAMSCADRPCAEEQ